MTDTPPPSPPDNASRPGPEAASKPPSKEKGVGLWGKLLNWLWQGNTAAEMKQLASSLPTETEELVRRAQSSCEVARQLRSPAEPLKYGPSLAAACEQYRQALYWTLLSTYGSQQEISNAASHGESAAGKEASLPEVLELLERGNSNARRLGTDSLSSLSDHANYWLGRDFRYYASLSLKQQRDAVSNLASLSRLVVERGAAPFDRRRIWRNRLLRSSVVIVSSAALVILGLAVAERVRLSKDLAKNKPWQASSDGGQSCVSPAKSCGEREFFFHTKNESQPWLIVDLLEPQTFSGVHVVNRLDCCFHRAIPLVLEVEQPDGTWREVARRNEQFESWRAEFEAVRASRIRLRVTRWSYLHLKDVKVLP